MRYLFLLFCWLATSAGAQQQDVQLRMSWWGGNEVHRAYLASIRRFEAKYPHIKVKGEYTGWYDQGQEEYVTETAAREQEFKGKISGKPLIKRTEPCYFFRLSHYQDRLL